MKKSKTSHRITTIKAEVHAARYTDEEQHAESEWKTQKRNESTKTEKSELQKLARKELQSEHEIERPKHITCAGYNIGAAVSQPKGRKQLANDCRRSLMDEIVNPDVANVEDKKDISKENSELKVKIGEYKLITAKEMLMKENEPFEEFSVTDELDREKKVQSRTEFPEHPITNISLPSEQLKKIENKQEIGINADEKEITKLLKRQKTKTFDKIGSLDDKLRRKERTEIHSQNKGTDDILLQVSGIHSHELIKHLQENDPNTCFNREYTTPAALSEKRSGSKRTVTIANYVVRQMRAKKEQTNWTSACEQESVKKRFKELQVNTDNDIIEQVKVRMSHEAHKSVYWDRYKKYDTAKNEIHEKEEYIPMSKRETERENIMQEVRKYRMYRETEIGMGEDTLSNLQFQGELPSSNSYWRRKHFQPNTEAISTYVLRKIVRKTKYIYNKYTKRDAAQDNNEKNSNQPKETEDKASLEQQKEEINFYKAARSDKPGDFLLHTGGETGPIHGPDAETQTEREFHEDYLFTEEIHIKHHQQEPQEKMRQQFPSNHEKWEICEKLKEEPISLEREKETKELDEKEKQILQQQYDKEKQSEQHEKENFPEQQEKQKLQEQKENIARVQDFNEKGQKPEETELCEETSTSTTTVHKPLTNTKMQEKLQLLDNPKTRELQEKTTVYLERVASIQNVFFQQKILSVPEKSEAQVYLGKLWKLKQRQSVEIEKKQEPGTQKPIDTLQVKQNTPELQKQLGTLEHERKSSSEEYLRDRKSPSPTKKTPFIRKLRDKNIKQKGKKAGRIVQEKIKKTTKPSKLFQEKMKKPLPLDEGDEDIYTGLFKTGARRTDLVLVTTANDNEHRENIKLDLLVGLIEMGIIVESEIGVFPEDQNIMFIKLYAPDDALHEYAGVLGVRKYFISSHENLIDEKISFLDRWFKLKDERQWLKSVRVRYAAPLRFSCQERSYIVYMMLRHQSALMGAGLERLLNTRILLNVYALHDGPFYCPYQKDFYTFNCRQVLFLHWAGKQNMFKYQPLHMIYEYFGSKLAFYFLFYGFYNTALIFASIWGIFMTIVYLIKDPEYFEDIRNFACTDDSRNKKNWNQLNIIDLSCAVACFQCEGETDPRMCPMTLIQDRCIDVHIMRYTDSPYIIFYSAGIALWALLFLTFWKRTERYWMWMWEENLSPKHQLFGTIGGTESLKMHEFQKKNKSKTRTVNGAINVLMSSCAIALLFIIIFIVLVYAHAAWTKPLAVKLLQFDYRYMPSWTKPAIPQVDNAMEILLLTLLTCCTLLILLGLEKTFHKLSWTLMTLETHLSIERFEKSLISKYFFYSFLYTSSLVVCFGWLKGLFHGKLVDVWDVNLNITTPWSSSNMKTPLSHITRRAITLNCSFFSCFREGVIVFVTTILVRDVIVRIATIIIREKSTKESEQKANDPMTTCEREYQLKPVTEQQVVDDFNTLCENIFHNLVLQFALVILFAPMFPLAPMLALALNAYDMRKKASMYIMHSRRALLFRSAGIGYWNHILKLICYAAPLFHALTWTRTEIFKKYLQVKFHQYLMTRWMFNTEDDISHDEGHDGVVVPLPGDLLRTPAPPVLGIKQLFRIFILMFEIHYDQLMNTHAEYIETNIDRVYSKFNTSLMVGYVIGQKIGTMQFCTIDGFYADKRKHKEISDDWPHQWNFIGENYSLLFAHPLHYYLKLVKVACILVYVLVFAALSVLVWQLVRGCPGRVARRLQRERVLRRLHQHRLTHLRQRAPDASD